MMVCFLGGGDVENRDPQNIKGWFSKKRALKDSEMFFFWVVEPKLL